MKPKPDSLAYRSDEALRRLHVRTHRPDLTPREVMQMQVSIAEGLSGLLSAIAQERKVVPPDSICIDTSEDEE